MLGTAGGPQAVPNRFGISSALTINGKIYVIDCGLGSVSQYVRAGLSIPSLDGIFLTHLHSDHTVDYLSYPIIALYSGGPTGPVSKPVSVYGPGPAGEQSLVATAPGPIPGTAAMSTLGSKTFAASTTFFLAEHLQVDPATLIDVHDVNPPPVAGASLANPAPDTMAPFTVLETTDLKVTAICVPHGAVYPAYAYRFDTDHGSIVFSGDTTVTPNIPRLARHADLLLHEAVDLAAIESLGGTPAGITHMRDTHTDVSLLGQIAAESDVPALVVTHLGPASSALVSDASWRRQLRDSARQAGYRGKMTLGMDLMHIPVGASS
nr:MBL fold metallo-hydrolase [Streptomyces sp. SID5914]